MINHAEYYHNILQKQLKIIQNFITQLVATFFLDFLTLKEQLSSPSG